jgi:phage gp45-like
MSFVNHIQQAISRYQTNVGNMRLAVISTVDPVNYTIKAVIEPEEVEMGPMPYGTPWIGWSAPPNVGDQCIILFQEGDKSVPVGAFLLYFLNGQLPPAGVAIGEAVLHHSSGSFVKLHNNGDVELNTTGNLNAIVTGTGNANVTAASGQITLTAPTINLVGNVTITGQLSANNGDVTMIDGNFTTNGTITSTVNVFAQTISLLTHVHGGVMVGSADTGGPI